MEIYSSYSAYDRRPLIPRNRAPAARWVKEWVPQDVVLGGGKCSVLKWIREDQLKALKEKNKEPEPKDLEPEPTTEVLFLCSYEGCGKTFVDVGALRKHANIHGERQFVCHYEGCGKKFLDSSKLKRHFLIHTGEKDFVCPYEGCGKAFSLDFNLRAHMRTHSAENYHVCPYEDCGRRYTHECKLKSHIKTHHEKGTIKETVNVKHTPPADKTHSTPKIPAATYGATPERPYACPYEGCGKAYIHSYKLNLHLKREHGGHNADENGKKTPVTDHDVEEASDHEAFLGKVGGTRRSSKRKQAPSQKMPPAKAASKKGSIFGHEDFGATSNLKKTWQGKPMYEEEEDSEETEEDRENIEDDGWRYRGTNGDDEEIEDED